ncbi:hypothetical protein ACFLU6_08920 [Acidobacteriota bacterium]
MMHLYITGNSPGEIAGWVQPVCECLKEQDRDWQTTLIKTPCQYSSGTELGFARSLPSIDKVITLGSFLRNLYLSGRENLPAPRRRTAVLYLGGDMFYAVLAARKLKAPLFCYTVKPRWAKHVRRFFVADERMKQEFLARDVTPDKIEVVGQLSLDTLPLDTKREELFLRLTGSKKESDIVTFLPGSRPQYVDYMVPFFQDVADQLSRTIPGLRMILALSPFVPKERIFRATGQDLPGDSKNLPDEIVSPSGCRIALVQKDALAAMEISRLIVTIPGTNTLQAAGMGVPMLVCLPLNKAEKIPLDGLAGLALPSLYPFGLLKRALLLRKNRHVKFVALPNLIAQRAIVPELRGCIEPAQVADKVVSLLADQERRNRMSVDLKKLTSKRGASNRIVRALISGLAAAEA